ncbi:MFS general substrate transporter [Thozetella sp. PMI_491]|nr:MFS general substrate transporter [Thozetella sp. PMI_491]
MTPATEPDNDTSRGGGLERLSGAEGSNKEEEYVQSSDGSLSQKSTREIRGIKWALICISLYVSAFLYGLDTTIAADVQGAVVEQFGNVDQLAWIGAGFPLGSVAVIFLVGNLYRYFNIKWLYIGSITFFEIGSVLCGAAPNMDALIVGRVLAGAGGTGLYLGCLNYFSTLAAAEERGLYISLIGCIWGVGAVLGPIIGGAFSVSSATWRWAFYINIVVGAAMAPICLFFLPPIHPEAGKTIWERVKQFDFVGMALTIAAWVFFTMAFVMAGGPWAWNDSRTIAMLTLFGVTLLLSVVQQYFTIFTTTATRTFPGHLLKSRTHILIFMATAASASSLYVMVYYIPIYFQFVHSDSAIQAAIRLLPFVAVFVVANVGANHLLSKIKLYMALYLVAGVLVVVGGSLLMVYLEPATSESTIYGLTVIVAFGTGITFQLGYTVSTLSVQPHDIGNALNFQNVAQLGGSVLSLVIASQVFQSTAVQNLNRVLDGMGFSQAEITSAVAGAQSPLFSLLTPELREAAIGAIVQAMRNTLVLVIVSGAVVLLVSVLLKRERLFIEAPIEVV